MLTAHERRRDSDGAMDRVAVSAVWVSRKHAGLVWRLAAYGRTRVAACYLAAMLGKSACWPTAWVTCTCNPLTHPMAVHAGAVPAVQIDDLYERRVDTWIRDYAGATHVLDVYRQKRVDKRKVFTSNYTRLRELPTMEHNAQALLMASMNSDTMGRLLDSR